MLPLRRFTLTITLGLLVFVVATSGCNMPAVSPAQTQDAPVTATVVTPSVVPATITPTVQPTPTAVSLVSPNELFSIILVKDHDELSLRQQPGAGSSEVGKIPAHTSGLVATGASQAAGNSNWIEIKTPEGMTGWVDFWNVTQQIPATQFCQDGAINKLVDDFIAAIKGRDGASLASLVSPQHGLNIRLEAGSPEVNLSGQETLTSLFTATTPYDWGSESGQVANGTFSEVILPKLDDVVLVNPTRTCNMLDQGIGAGGITAGYIQWPFEYSNLNYIALYRPAPQGNELNWRTWAIGIEYVQGKPYIAFLVHYHWEI